MQTLIDLGYAHGQTIEIAIAIAGASIVLVGLLMARGE
jgi:hypothetical protein